jgi:hypothetical protein
LYNGLQSGNALQTLAGGIQLGNALGSLMGESGSNVVSSAIADTTIARSLGVSAGQVVPIINLLISLEDVEDNPWGTVAAAAACFPPVGTFIAAFITVIQIAFPTDIPPTIGEASVEIDPDGVITVNTTVDEEGGGSYAAQWANAMAEMALGAGMRAPQAGAAAQHLPTVGYYFDPDGVNLSDTNGQLELHWTDANGAPRQRIYDANGMAWDGDSVAGQSDIMRDYQMLIHNMEPRWPPVMYQQMPGGILQLDYGVATVLYATAMGDYDGMAEHTQGGDEDTDGGVAHLDTSSGIIYGLQDNTIANTSTQTQQTLGAQDIRTATGSGGGGNPPMGNAANGPQIPKGKDPIVFVPTQAMLGSRTVTAGKVGDLNANDAQLAAMAIAMGAGALPFMSHKLAQLGQG